MSNMAKFIRNKIKGDKFYKFKDTNSNVHYVRGLGSQSNGARDLESQSNLSKTSIRIVERYLPFNTPAKRVRPSCSKAQLF